MRYEWKARLFLGLICFLIGVTSGWLAGDAGYSVWWLYVADFVFLVVVGYLAYKTYFGMINVNSQQQVKDKER